MPAETITPTTTTALTRSPSLSPVLTGITAPTLTLTETPTHTSTLAPHLTTTTPTTSEKNTIILSSLELTIYVIGALFIGAVMVIALFALKEET